MLRKLVFLHENGIDEDFSLWQKAGDFDDRGLCRRLADLAAVIRRYCILGCHGCFGILVTTGTIRLEESVDGRVAGFVHAESVVVLQPHNES